MWPIIHIKPWIKRSIKWCSFGFIIHNKMPVGWEFVLKKRLDDYCNLHFKMLIKYRAWKHRRLRTCSREAQYGRKNHPQWYIDGKLGRWKPHRGTHALGSAPSITHGQRVWTRARTHARTHVRMHASSHARTLAVRDAALCGPRDGHLRSRGLWPRVSRAPLSSSLRRRCDYHLLTIIILLDATTVCLSLSY